MLAGEEQGGPDGRRPLRVPAALLRRDRHAHRHVGAARGPDGPRRRAGGQGGHQAAAPQPPPEDARGHASPTGRTRSTSPSSRRGATRRSSSPGRGRASSSGGLPVQRPLAADAPRVRDPRLDQDGWDVDPRAASTRQPARRLPRAPHPGLLRDRQRQLAEDPDHGRAGLRLGRDRSASRCPTTSASARGLLGRREALELVHRPRSRTTPRRGSTGCATTRRSCSRRSSPSGARASRRWRRRRGRLARAACSRRSTPGCRSS